MSERRWSTRLKAKLLRRSSTSSRNLKLSTTTSNTSASTSHDTPPIPSDDPTGASIKAERKAAESADPVPVPVPDSAATTTTPPPISTPKSKSKFNLVSHPDSDSGPDSHPPPPLSSSRRPSNSSYAESQSRSQSQSQYTPDELASATGSPGGQYFFVPEYRQPASCSSAQREEQSTTATQSSPAKTVKGTQSPYQDNTPTRRSTHDRERARSGSSSKSLPSELLSFPLPTRKGDLSAPLSPTANLDHPVTPLSSAKTDRWNVPPNFSPQRHASADLTTPLHAVAEKPFNTYHSFPHPPTTFPARPSLSSRRQSLLPASHQHLVRSLLDTGSFSEPVGPAKQPTGAGMGLRKIWVRRPGGSATLLPTTEDALVDELRDQVVVKYANSVGRAFDAPDIVIRIAMREGSNRLPTPDRILSPEEPLWSVVDSYYPGGQTVTEALVIEIPQRRTPKPSPRHNVYFTHSEPGEHGDYFPLMPSNNLNVSTPPHQATSATSNGSHPAPSISILTTGHAPQLPSPGARPRHRRPPITRHTTHSPTLLGSAPSKDASAQSAPSQPTPPVPTPPAPAPESPHAKAHTPPARVSSPRPGPNKTKKPGRASLLNAAFGGLIEGTVPPINVLIVEDNVINQRLLEAFMKRLSVRWKCAANGAEAVAKWREGGFHLVLMDIQLPVMNGLDATKEIRRLERLNGIGVFPKKSGSSPAAATDTSPDPVKEEDTLSDLSLFKSPVIVVALTASSLQSDRHEALAAGCNDFLTKPVRFEWLEQKVTEWGCMQALIDFEGWRKWRGFASPATESSSGRTSPDTRNDTNKTSPIASPSPSPAKKLDQARLKTKASEIAEDSQDSTSGSDSPVSLHTDRPSPMQEANV
ncbi:hypothetical protein BDV18DRAFT_138931 [Aspergillus unguis]